MLKSYLKVAVRNLSRYKGFSFINIFGLAIGITGCLLIGLFVWDEKQYDKFIDGSEQIYRIYNKTTRETGVTFSSNTAPAYASQILQNPEVLKTARLMMWSGKMLFEVNGKRAYENKGLIADSTFLDIFPLKFTKGDIHTALNEPNSVVISAELAKQYFGRNSPVGKAIMLDKSPFMVTGVLGEIPEHFHLDFSYIIPLSALSLPPDRMQRWTWGQFFTYIKVRPDADIQALEKKFQAVVARNAHEQTRESGYTFLPYLQSLKDIHLHSANFEYDNAKRGNASYVKSLTIIAGFVLLIGCFNFINLATARSLRRAKEIGVRKVIGASRQQLMLQFTGETILISLIAIFVAEAATVFLLPSLNAFTGKHIPAVILTDTWFILLMISAAFAIGILSGIYPALVMSRFQPIKVLKGLRATGTGTGSASLLRQGLVIIQFSLSALLIICTIIVYRQMKFLHEKDLGFSKEQVIYFDVRGGVAEKTEVFKNALKKSPGVVSVTGGYGLPGDQLATDGIIVPGNNQQQEYTAVQLIVDYDYIKTMGAEIIAGRDFSHEFSTDSTDAFIINETGVKELGFGTPAAALGRTLHWQKWLPDSVNPVKKGKVIGVVRDFHVKSLHEKLSTTVLHIYPQVLVKMAVKVRTTDLGGTISFIRSVWNQFAPDYPLDYKFLDENFAAMYGTEDKLSVLLLIFTAMAILVGCLGLFGLAAFSAEQRIKEIGIRKVLGASVLNIVTMLSRNLLIPVFIACFIAFPVAWWVMSKWLEDFEYRIVIEAWIFVISAVIALVIALLTVSFQSIKAATINPVTNLRAD
jgi:putative ABC transport system permease protein